jgi:arginine-tRNA-protein transferase
MADMGFADYRAMIEDTPLDSHLIDFRDADGKLYGACLTDRMADGLSLVYSFFDPDESFRSPGIYIILWHVNRARALGLEYVYLGYWIKQSPKMAYKSRFNSVEALTTDGWRRMDPAAD